MEIAIIGSGNVGKALAGATVRNGHSVTLTAADPDHARTAAESVGARAADSNLEAVDRAELVVLAVYSPVVVHVLDETIDALAGKILVDPTNPRPQTPTGRRSRATRLLSSSRSTPLRHASSSLQHGLRRPAGKPGRRRYPARRLRRGRPR
jgi:predicted dinucleotide-binding enzyme